MPEGQVPEKPLENFHFYKNVPDETSLEQAVKMYNQEHPDKSITIDDVRFGPDFHEFVNFPLDLQYRAIIPATTEFRFSYRHTDHSRQTITCHRGRVFSKGMFIYSEKSGPENLAEVLEELEKEDYLEDLSIRTTNMDGYEIFLVINTDIQKFMASVAKENEWRFEELKDDAKQDIGYLTVDGETFLVREEWGGPSRLTLYNKNGRRLDLRKGLGRYKGILEKIGKPISEELKRQEREYWLSFGRDINNPEDW